jgi:hypothetical protein
VCELRRDRLPENNRPGLLEPVDGRPLGAGKHVRREIGTRSRLQAVDVEDVLDAYRHAVKRRSSRRVGVRGFEFSGPLPDSLPAPVLRDERSQIPVDSLHLRFQRCHPFPEGGPSPSCPGDDRSQRAFL